MKLLKKTIIFFLCLVSVNEIIAQSENFGEPIIPLQTEKSVLFGSDTFINDQPLQNQRNLDICSAFNGWLFAVYCHYEIDGIWWTILKSVDHGKDWQILFDKNTGYYGDTIPRMNIHACGTDTSNLYLFVSGTIYFHLTNQHQGFVSRFNYSLNDFDDYLFNDFSIYVRDLALATDFQYPATGSNPNSIAVLYSKAKNAGSGDTIILATSSDGGNSLDLNRGVFSSSKYISKVSLAFGRGASFTSGRYFASWQEVDSATMMHGHIYTAHTEPNFNSPLTSPIQLDEGDTSLNNKLKNPVVACQFNNSDNDSSNLTEVIICEKYIASDHKNDLIGFYTKKATQSTSFQTLSITTSTNNKLEPEISFNPFDSTFMVTYYDSTAQKLPFLKNSFNLPDPNSWNIVSDGYNDSADIAKPYPKIVLDLGQQIGINAWVAERTNGNGMAFFDSPHNYPVGISVNKFYNDFFEYSVYPNPTTANINLKFMIKSDQEISIYLINNLGQKTSYITNRHFSPGLNIYNIDLSNFNSNIFYLGIQNGNNFHFTKVLLVK